MRFLDTCIVNVKVYYNRFRFGPFYKVVQRKMKRVQLVFLWFFDMLNLISLGHLLQIAPIYAIFISSPCSRAYVDLKRIMLTSF